MTLNLKNFLNDKTKLSKMGEFQNLKQIEGLEEMIYHYFILVMVQIMPR
jgi:hypothetical protein